MQAVVCCLHHLHMHIPDFIIISCNAWLHHFLLACSHVYRMPHNCTIPFIPFVQLFLFVYAYNISLCVHYCIHSFVQYMIGLGDVSYKNYDCHSIALPWKSGKSCTELFLWVLSTTRTKDWQVLSCLGSINICQPLALVYTPATSAYCDITHFNLHWWCFSSATAAGWYKYALHLHSSSLH